MSSVSSQDAAKQEAVGEVEQEPPKRLGRADILAIVQSAESCQPLTSQEIAEASKRRGRAGRLLAAAVLHNMRVETAEREGEEADELRPQNLMAFVHVDAANQAVSNMKGRKTNAKDRAITFQKQAEAVTSSGEAAQGFLQLVDALQTFSTEFDDQYSEDDRPDLDALDALYDKTDDIPHPLHNALPLANRYPGDDPRRDAVMQATHLLRYILLQAQSTQQGPTS